MSPGAFFGIFIFQFIVAIGITIYFFVLLSRISKSLQRIADKVDQIEIKNNPQVTGMAPTNE